MKEDIMSSLKAALKTVTTSKGSSSKNAAFYNKEKNNFIAEMSVSVHEVTRIDVGRSEHVPAGTLKQMLVNETETDVLKVLLMNPRTPLKAIIDFAGDPRARQFDDDPEVIDYLKNRMSGDEG